MAETNQERVERLLGVDAGEVLNVGTKPHPNGLEYGAVLRSGSFRTGTVGLHLWEPPPMKVAVKRGVVGEHVVGKRVIGREQVGTSEAGEPLYRDVTEDVMGPAPESDAVLSQRATAEAQAKAKAAGWRRFAVEGVEVAEKQAVVTVICG